ncbi:hypothetical protein [Anaerofustis sp.]|uniref:hypothetical protein n=1 Tax=Anaerofustis sp. TaxID=1872517 RepID=UPI0025B8FF27|nr:hypothetical protein [Anaerofustis sp.]
MKSKTKQLIARIIVGFLVVLMVLGAVSPYIFGAEKYKKYTNEDLHISMKIPSSAKKDMERLSENSREFPVNFHLTARITYGDIYDEVLDDNKLDKKELKRRQVYIESNFVKDTWNNEEYISKYFKGILADAKSEYRYKISKSNLSGIPAWKCHYEGKSTKSEGYYYLTVTNGGLYVLQLDCYLEDISNYRSTVNKIKDSFEITDLVIPTQKEMTEITKEEKKDTVKPQKTDNNAAASTKEDTVKDKESAGIVVFDYFLIGLVAIAFVGSIVAYIVKQKKYKKMKNERRKIRVKRRNNDKME